MKRFKKLISRFFDNKKDGFKADTVNSEEEFLKKAANYVDKGDIKKAISILEEAEKLIPNSEKVLSVLVKLHKQVGEPEIADNYIKELLSISKVEKAQVDLELPNEIDFDFLSEKSKELQEVEYSFDSQESEEVLVAGALNLKKKNTICEVVKPLSKNTNLIDQVPDNPKKILSLKSRKTIPYKTENKYLSSKVGELRKEEYKKSALINDGWIEVDKKKTSQTGFIHEEVDNPTKILRKELLGSKGALSDNNEAISETNRLNEVEEKSDSKKLLSNGELDIQNKVLDQELDYSEEQFHDVDNIKESTSNFFQELHTEKEPVIEEFYFQPPEANYNQFDEEVSLPSEETEFGLDAPNDLESNEESFYDFWEDDEFEENDKSFEEDDSKLNGVLESDISLEDRGRMIAVDFIATFDWEKSQLPLLMEIFSSKGWRNIKTALEREVSAGATFEEVQLAYEIRTLWQDSSRYWINFNKAHCPGESTDATYRHCSWKQVLRLIKFFGYQPIFEEVYNFLEFEFEFWFNHEIMRRCFPSFNKYLFNYRLHSRNMTSIFGYFEKTEPYDEMNEEWYFYTNSLEMNELKGFGVDLHSRFTPKNSHISDAYTHDYLLDLYNSSSIKSTIGDSN